MIQGVFEGDAFAAVLNATFALSATRLPVGKPFFVVGSSILSLKHDKGEMIMNRDGSPMPFPVLLIRFVKKGDSAPSKCQASRQPNNKQRYPAEVVTATIPTEDGVVNETLFLSTITRDVRDAVDETNQFVRIQHTGVAADAARAAQAANDTNEKALVRICKAIYAVQDTGKCWILKANDCAKLTREGRRYPAIYVNLESVAIPT
nr:MAG TPA: hypothetical protein [Bacteriophage sp.]